MKKFVLLLAALLALPALASDPPRTKLTGVEVERSLVPPLCTEEYQTKKAGEICRDASGNLKRWDGTNWQDVGGGTAEGLKADTPYVDSDNDGTIEGRFDREGGYGATAWETGSARFAAGDTLYLVADADGDGTGEVCLDVDDDSTCDASVSTNAIATSAVQLGSSIVVRLASWDTDHDGTLDEKIPYLDEDRDGSWDVGERLLGRPWDFVERFDDWENWGADGGGGSRTLYSGQVPGWGSYRYDSANPENTTSCVSSVQCYEPADGNYCFALIYTPDNATIRQYMDASKMRGFRARVARHTANHAGTVLVGAVHTSTNGDLRTKTDGLFFWCDPSGDPNGDGTSADSDGDADWWVCAYAGAADCKQIADGDGDNKLDCDLDGTPDTLMSDFSSYATCRRMVGQSCKAAEFAVVEMQRLATGAVTFRIDSANGGAETVWDYETTISSTLPDSSHLVTGWVAGVDAEGSAIRVIVDWSYYVGVR